MKPAKTTDCYICGGSGVRSAAQEMGMQDYPVMMQPVGVRWCEACNGTGGMELYSLKQLLDEEGPAELRSHPAPKGDK